MGIKSFAAYSALVLSASALSVPAFAANIVETAAEAGTFNTLLAAATEAGLANALATTDNITVFAPSDDAFAALPEGTVEMLLKPENLDQLTAILTMHVLPRELASKELPAGPIHVKTLNADQMLAISKSSSDHSVTVAGSTTANVVAADIMADNGIIHVIDTVLLPNLSSTVQSLRAAQDIDTPPPRGVSFALIKEIEEA